MSVLHVCAGLCACMYVFACVKYVCAHADVSLYALCGCMSVCGYRYECAHTCVCVCVKLFAPGSSRTLGIGLFRRQSSPALVQGWVWLVHRTTSRPVRIDWRASEGLHATTTAASVQPGGAVVAHAIVLTA